MPGYFFDSSALAKHYHVEVGTAEVDRILQLPDTRHFIARLALVEIRSVFAGKVRTGSPAPRVAGLSRSRWPTREMASASS